MPTREELFQEHQLFAYWLLNKQFPSIANDEDVKQEALIGLWAACCTYDSSLGKFSTLATRCITNQVLMWIRKSNKYKKVAACSLDDPIQNCDNMTLADRIPDPNWETAFVNAEFTRKLHTLSQEDRVIVKLRLLGETQSYIAKQLGRSQAYVSRRLKQIYRRMNRR